MNYKLHDFQGSVSTLQLTAAVYWEQHERVIHSQTLVMCSRVLVSLRVIE